MSAAQDTTASVVVNKLTDWWMGVPGVELAARPETTYPDVEAGNDQPAAS